MNKKIITIFLEQPLTRFEQAQPKMKTWQTPMKAKIKLPLQSWKIPFNPQLGNIESDGHFILNRKHNCYRIFV